MRERACGGSPITVQLEPPAMVGNGKVAASTACACASVCTRSATECKMLSHGSAIGWVRECTQSVSVCDMNVGATGGKTNRLADGSKARSFHSGIDCF